MVVVVEFSSLSFSLLFSSLFLFSLPGLVVSLSPLSATMTMITRPVGLSLCAHTALTCQRVRVPVLWLIPCLAELVRIKKLSKPRAIWNEVGPPVLEMGDVSVFVSVCVCVRVCLCLAVFVCVCLCLVVFGCVSMC